jgi:release factor glutamine methyltransferase
MSDDRAWSVLELLRWTTDFFRSRGIETPRLDAEVLLAHALESERLGLYLEFEKPVTPEERTRFRSLVRRRAEERVPVAYLTGEREFWSLPLRVTPDVLVPRPDTEVLVAAALERLPEVEREWSILDVGTGSGAVALALASERPKARVTASDLSDAALDVARDNAQRLELSDRLRFVAGDLFAPVAGERFDAVVSNPPYVADGAAGLSPELSHEPDAALFAGREGADVLRRMTADAAGMLSPDGVLALELAPAQAPLVAEWLEARGFRDVQTHRDLAGLVRVISARWPGDKE